MLSSLKRIFLGVMAVFSAVTLLFWYSINNGYIFQQKILDKISNELYSKANDDCSEIIFNKKQDFEKVNVKIFPYSFESVKCLIKQIERSDADEVVFDYSPGGNMISSIVLGKYLNKNEIGLTIKNGCDSACSITLFMNQYSKVCENAYIGIHQSAYMKKMTVDEAFWLNFFKVEESLNAYVFQNLKEAGVDMQHFKVIWDNTENDDMKYLNSKQLIDKNYIKSNKC